MRDNSGTDYSNKKHSDRRKYFALLAVVLLLRFQVPMPIGQWN